jgi:hypothetical protein
MILTALFQGIVTLMLIAGTITSVESVTPLDITGLKAQKAAIFQSID